MELAAALDLLWAGVARWTSSELVAKAVKHVHKWKAGAYDQQKPRLARALAPASLNSDDLVLRLTWLRA